MALKRHVRPRVDGHRDLVAGLHALELRLFEVRHHPHVRGNQREQRGARLHQRAGLHVAFGDKPVERGADFGIGEVQVGRFQLRFSLLNLTLARFHVGFLLADLQLYLLCHFQLRLRAGQASLGAAQLGVCGINALLGGRARVDAALATVLRLRVRQIGLCFQHLRFGFVTLGGILHF